MEKENIFILCDKGLIEDRLTIRKRTIQRGDKIVKTLEGIPMYIEEKKRKSSMYDLLESLAGSQDTYSEERNAVFDSGYLLR